MTLRFNLFWKIFLWLWLTLILFIAVHLVLMSLSRAVPHIEPLSPSNRPALERMAKRLEHGFPPGARDRPRGRRFRPELFILDKQGDEIHGRAFDPTVSLLHSRYLENGEPAAAYKDRSIYAGPFIVQHGDRPRYIYTHRRLHPLGQEHLKIIWAQAPRNLLISAVLITFPVCIALAWYLSAPIRRLQAATEEFSSTTKVPARLEPLLERGDEFGDLSRDFRRMASRVQHTLASQNQLLSDVSHELRSPLARMRIALGLAEQKAAGTTDRRELDQMILECDRMDWLIGRLLDLARMDNVSSDEEKVPSDLAELLTEWIADAGPEAGGKGLMLRDALPAQPLPIKAVPELLRSAVENILRNAIHHAPRDSVIDIELRSDAPGAVLSIRDHGPGVDEAHLDKIFEPFYRPQYARERGSGGAGLGLAIARRAVIRHGGHIRAENAADGGLRVVIELPRYA